MINLLFVTTTDTLKNVQVNGFLFQKRSFKQKILSFSFLADRPCRTVDAIWEAEMPQNSPIVLEYLG